MSRPGPHVEETELGPPRKRRAAPDPATTAQLAALNVAIVNLVCAAIELAPQLGDASPKAARLKRAVDEYHRASDALVKPAPTPGEVEA